MADHSRIPSRAASRASTDRVLWLMVVCVGLMLALFSTCRYLAYNTGMHDIGNMAQAIWSTSEGFPLEFSYNEGFLSRLSLHVEVTYFLIAPLYLLFPTPVTLLVFQAFLFVLGAFPVYRLAEKRLGGTFAARISAMIYLIYPVALSSVLFDFHGDTLAMPILCYAIESADRRNWKTYCIWLALALGCKFYVSAATAAFGFLLIFDDRKKAGYTTIIASIAWFLTAILLIRPHFAPQTEAIAQSSLVGYLTFYFGRTANIADFYPGLRLLTATIIFAPALVVGRYCPRWLLPATVIAFPALLAVGNVSAFSYLYHHYALTVPFGMLAIIRGAERLKKRLHNNLSVSKAIQTFRGRMILSLIVTTLLSALLINIPINPLFWVAPPGWGFDELAYGRTSRDIFKDNWLELNIPLDAKVITSMMIAPHLVNRRTLFLFDYPCSEHLKGIKQRLEMADIAVADALFDYATPEIAGGKLSGGHPSAIAGGVLYDSPAIAALLQSDKFKLVDSRDGMLLFRVGTAVEDSLQNRFSIDQIETTLEIQHSFAGIIDLVDSSCSLSDKRLQLSFKWKLSQGATETPQIFAVTRIEGVGNARIVHLPTMVQHPASLWQENQEINEYFEIFLPSDLENETYKLFTGWFSADKPYSWATDSRSTIGAEAFIGSFSLKAK